MKRIQEAGKWLEQAFREADYRTDAFPTLAEAAIVDFDLVHAMSIESVLSLGIEAGQVPTQSMGGASSFGQPPVTLYWHPHFVIDAYFWATGTTTIHEHGFSGAFAVASGSSLQSRYRFEEFERFGDTVWVGALHQLDLEYLRQGDCRQIWAGDKFIHSVFHLESPSLSLCVRTSGGRNLIPVQRDFSPVGLARDPFFTSERLKLLPRIIGFGLEYREALTLRELRSEISRCDALEAWTVLDRVYAHFGRDLEPVHQLIEATSQRHAPLRDYWYRYYDALTRERVLIDLRHTIEDAVQRKVLGLILNAHCRERLADGIKGLLGTSNDPLGLNRFLELAHAMGFKDGSPNMEAIVAGFGLSDEDSKMLHQVLSSLTPLSEADLSSLQDNTAFGAFLV